MKESNSFQSTSTSVKVFENASFGAMRVVVGDNQKTWFNLADTCRALEIRNARDVKTRLAKRGVVTADTPTRNQFGAIVMQPMTYIDEANLYRCIFQSRKAEAEKFQAWVFDEVLPQIRRTGGYIPTRNPRTGEALTEAEILRAADRIVQCTIQNKNLPAAECFTASEVAKSVGLTVNELNLLLVSAGIQYWNGGRYKLTPKHRDKGLAMDRKFHYYSLEGEKRERFYLVWTQEGKSFIENMVKQG